jgi:tetratricopeptide (TPR) repeat protein
VRNGAVGTAVNSGELTRRENDVLVALCRPLSTEDVVAQPASVREIAAELVVTEAAVKQHLIHLYDKLGIAEGGERRRVTLAREAVRLGLVAAPERLSGQAEGTSDNGPLASARASWGRREWDRAAELFELAAASAPLAADDLVLQAEAYLWANRHDEAFTANERAYQAYLQAGAERRAGYVAVLLTFHNAVRLDMAVARGWLAKAQKLLEPECREYGYLALVVTLLKEAAGDWDAVLEQAGHMDELGRRHKDPDLEALGLAFRGLVATRRGSLEEGGQLLDEAMASAVAGELGMLATGIVYCRMLTTCLALQDYRRAGEWTDVVDRCGHTTGLGGFPGDCQMHRTAVLVKRGSWARGEEEALRAFEEARGFDLPHAGGASYELGGIRLRQGDLDAAEEAFLRAHEFGSSPQPGMALVQLARGETAAAAASIEDACENSMLDALARAPLLNARVEIELAMGNLESLRDVASELEETARTFGTPALAASAAYARGAAVLMAGDMDEAMRLLADAQRLWLDAEAPYEAARTRELLAQAQFAAGKYESGRLELRATQAAFTRLGAPIDIERVERRLASLGQVSPPAS